MYPESSGNHAQAALESGALVAPAPRQGGDGAQSTKHKAQSTGVLVLVACGAGRPRYPKTNGFRPSERSRATTASPLGR